MTGNRSIPIRTIEQLKDGSSEAFEEIYRLLGGRVYNFMRSSLGDAYLAEELLQDFFLKVWEKRNEIDPKLNFESYLFTVARHMVFRTTEQVLAERVRRRPMEEASAISTPSPEQEVEAQMLEQFIARQVEQLPPVCRTVYQMSRSQHLSRYEIAQRLSISERTVDTHLYLALKTLKSKLGLPLLLAALAHCFGV